MDSVSVIIATCNRAAKVGMAVRSALEQMHPPLEVLVCDDGSDDDTEQVVRSIDDPRVIWLPGEHAGRPAIPRNRGIRNSRGEWLAFLDDDDEWLPEKLAAQLASMKRIDCLASCTNALGTGTVAVPGTYGLGWSDPRLTFYDLLRGNRVVCSSAVIHRSVLEKAEGFPEAARFRAMEDYALWLRVAVSTDFAFVNEPLVRYHDTPQTSIRTVRQDASWQKRVVLANFLAWGCRKGISSAYLRHGLASYGDALLVSWKRLLSGSADSIFRSSGEG